MTRRALPFAALSTVLALGACGSGGDETVTVAATPVGLARAASATLDGGRSGRFTALMDIELMSEPFHLAFDGAYDGHGLVEVTMDMGQVMRQFAGDAALPPGFDGTARYVMDRTTMYICWSMFEALTGDPCGSMDLAVTGVAGADFGGGDPTAALRILGAADGVEEVGAEEIDGVQTTHFAGVVTPRQGLAAAGPDHVDEVEAQFRRLGLEGNLDAPIALDVWVDGEGLVRRMVQDVDLQPGGGLAGGSVHSDVRLYGFGDDVQIDLPDDDDVADLTELMGEFDPNG